ncbi:MAG TPA: dephospho-CoA kinase [Oscillatoriaceae cyanobacterium]
MRIIGLTGGIGTGKTTVANMLARKGAVLIDSDLIAREIVEPGAPAYREIVAAFGSDVVRADGTLDRAKLGAIVFSDQAKLHQLNAMTHPRVRQVMLDRLAELQGLPSPPPAAVLVIPLLFENALEHLVEEVWVVASSPACARERLIVRDGFSPEEAERRIAAQLPIEQKVARAGRVIHNEGDFVALQAEVDAIWRSAGLVAIP